MTITRLSIFLAVLSLCRSKLQCAAVSESKCGANEKYTECGSGCGDLTCENPSYANLMCPAVCIQGCFCVEGYVRDNGICIMASACKVKCPLHEHSTECGAGCEPTCDRPDPNKLICTKICRKGCVCDSGFVRNKQGQCVVPGKCPCGKNESINKCGTVASCEATCKNPSMLGVFCPDVCIEGCFCNEGFVRNLNRNCVPVSECTNAECDKNEQYKECGSVCQSTCEQPEEILCRDKCRPGCYCKKGFVRNVDEKCVKVEDCPSKKCVGNEVYTDCGSACGDDTCDNYKELRMCIMMCKSGCFCPPDFVRNSAGECISKEKCP